MAYFILDGYSRSIPTGVSGVDGSIVIPSAKPFDKLKPVGEGHYRDRLLLDPQLYLAELDGSSCRKRCMNLATYPWLQPASLPAARTTGQQSVRNWIKKGRKLISDHWLGSIPSGDEMEPAVLSALVVQEDIGCEFLILPSPLTIDPNSDLTIEMAYLDAGLSLGRNEFETPLCATVALSDACLLSFDPYENRLIDAVLDQVSAREPDGVYIVVEMSSEDGYYLTSPNTLGSLLRLCHGFSLAGIRRIVVNFATVAGLLTLAAGADTLCTAWYRSERRLRISELKDGPEGPSAYPAYYSHSLASEIHLQNDLDVITDGGFLSAIADETSYSAGLLRALEKGRSVADVPEWKHARNNLTSAKGHFAERMASEVGALMSIPPDTRSAVILSWLDGASKLARKLNSLSDLHPRTDLRHQRNWLKAFEKFKSRS